ncbi:putative inorganic phosphate transporter [Arachis hypogaea]|nr:putative inorganic phosphate transporter [Arachis hypogaea]
MAFMDAAIGSVILVTTRNENSLDKTKADAGYSPGIGIKNSLLILGVVNTLGFLFTFLVPEPNGKSLEEISGEHELGNEGQGASWATVVV